MFLGQFFVFKCDFCDEEFERPGYGLPDGMKWIAANMLRGLNKRHICAACIKKGKHGDEKLRNSGEL